MTEPTPRPPIRRLDVDTISKIAAGEVVERPASVVKELVENAIDAGAHEVSVYLKEGGLETIEVEDDGTGIAADELVLAVERHATSKLSGPDGLGRIHTLGFRGEALAAVAAISRFRIISRPPGAEAAHGLSVVGGSIVGEFDQGRAPGTSVEVNELFFNTPARRKFLHTPAAEQVEVASTMERLYLARPGVGLRLFAGDQELARYPPTAVLADAAAYVFGTEFLDQMVPVTIPEAHGVGLSAVVARPVISRSTSQGIFLSINGRTVQSRILAQAVRQAYSDYLPRTRFPVGVLQLNIDLSRVDVNVHPTKREVRIAKEREVADLLRRAVRAALQEAPHAAERPGVAPRATAADTRFAGSPSALPAFSLTPEPSPLRVPLAGMLAGRQTQLFPVEDRRHVAPTSRHPGIDLLGVLFHLYWVAEAEGHLVLVDQHAASERVVYEALRSEGGLARQELVSPVQLSLTARQVTVLRAHAAQIRDAGFEVEPFGGATHRVLAVPVYRGHFARADVLPAMLDELADGGRPTVPDGLAERVAASLACHAAVRGGDAIGSEQMGRILESLYDLPEASYACPHGRPILVRFGRGQLDRWFLRSGP